MTASACGCTTCDCWNDASTDPDVEGMCLSCFAGDHNPSGDFFTADADLGGEA